MVGLIYLCVSASLREKKFSHKKAQEVQRWKEDGAGKMRFNHELHEYTRMGREKFWSSKVLESKIPAPDARRLGMSGF
jgi:hypothetical protein